MKLIIVRHGQSEADILNVHEGRADFPLTDRGKKQALLLSKWLAENEEFDVILSSPLKRTKETAQLISKETGKSIKFCDELMEWNNGLLAGLTREEASIRFPIPKGGRKPHHEIANSESMINFRARAESFLSRLKEEYPQDMQICIVSHGGMINMLYRSLLNLPIINEQSISCDDTSIHKFILTKDGCCIEYINRTTHLLELL